MEIVSRLKIILPVGKRKKVYYKVFRKSPNGEELLSVIPRASNPVIYQVGEWIELPNNRKIYVFEHKPYAMDFMRFAPIAPFWKLLLFEVECLNPVKGGEFDLVGSVLCDKIRILRPLLNNNTKERR